MACLQKLFVNIALRILKHKIRLLTNQLLFSIQRESERSERMYYHLPFISMVGFDNIVK